MKARRRKKLCRLIQRARASEPYACDRLVRQYTPRLMQMTGRFAANATAHPQLLGAAVAGLLDGVKHIQLDRLTWRLNVDPVWAYVKSWVLHALCEELGRSELGLSPGACKAWLRVWETWHQLRQQLQREPTTEEVAAASRVSKRVVEEILHGPAQPVLEDCNDGDTAEAVGGVVVQEPNDHAGQVNSQADYVQAVQQLTPVTRQLQYMVVDVCCEYLGYSYPEIVECLGQPTRGAHVVYWERVRPSLQWLFGALLLRWSQVSDLFATPPPTLTPAALEQWHRRARQEIRRKMLCYLVSSLGAMAPLYAG